MSSPKAIDPAEQASRGKTMREDAMRLIRVAIRMWDTANRIDPHHHQPENAMGIETTIIQAYKKKADDAQASNVVLNEQVTDLQTRLTNAQASTKDATDLQTEQASLTDLGLDANGNPVQSPPAA